MDLHLPITVNGEPIEDARCRSGSDDRRSLGQSARSR